MPPREPYEPRPTLLDASAEELYDDAPCGYLTATPDGMITRVNATFLRWTGYADVELVGVRRFADLLTAGCRIYHETHYAPLLRMQGEVHEIAVDIVRADGSRLPALVNSVLKFTEDGTPVGIRTTVFDATERQRYERELLHARNRERAARERLEALQHMTAALAAASGVEDIATAIAAELARTLGARGAGIGEIDPESGAVLVLAARGEPTQGEVLRLPFATPSGPRGELWVALPPDGPRDAEVRSFVQACADQVAVALERTRLYEQARSVAETLQRSVLTAPPAEPGVELAVRYEPGEEHLEVGGDWYDAFRLPGDRLGIVVGDVIGRGAPAAGAMGQLRSAVRAIAGPVPEPGAVLSHLDAFVEELPAARYATVVFLTLDLGSGSALCASAGHLPLLLLRGEGSRFLDEGRSPPLGVPPAGVRPQASFRLAPGEGLLAYTDGLVERRGESIDVGLERLRAAVDAASASSAEALAAALPAALRGPGTGTDDVCLLALRFRAGG